jgi:predicted nucleic acid-binding protein
MEHRQATLPPVVLTELISDPALSSDVKALLAALPMLEVLDGYWERAGLLRARLQAQGRKARLADTLIAQSCLDHDIELVTRDRDFFAFAQAAGLRLLAPRSAR